MLQIKTERVIQRAYPECDQILNMTLSRVSPTFIPVFYYYTTRRSIYQGQTHRESIISLGNDNRSAIAWLPRYRVVITALSADWLQSLKGVAQMW